MLSTAYHLQMDRQTEQINQEIGVVATTCWNSTHSMLTSAKLTEGYLVVEITRELNKEPLLHCFSIYINTKWSILQQCVYLISYYLSTILLPQGHHAISICSDVILFNLCHYVCTMYTPCVHHEEPLSFDIIPNLNSF